MTESADRPSAPKAPVAADAAAGAAGRAEAGGPIVLHCDLKVDPARESEMLDHFHRRFRPVAARQAGFIDLKMLRLRAVLQGPGPQAHVRYRFQLTFESEPLRLAWTASADHDEVWPGIGACLTEPDFLVVLWEDA